ncbi:protein PROLINE CONTENT ALTERNATIVE 22 [Humulus lupulus]|uniref:protein PROLINE CONTENT ALTERNATIVE 22 n=1 Tax=Humulus lupulus TaxID=3486 RepID=UPI002B402B7E|nr:protein PROLINE CONTENT ALTERNATIVE 22 [Humulus lupulus]
MKEKRIVDGFDSPSSSPPTPPSPLPVSVGPGNQKYLFSPSPSLSPPFSPPSSSHDSTELLHLLQEDKKLPSPRVPSVFSLDLVDPDILDSKSSCLKDLLEWFVERCCNICSNKST